MLLDLKDKKYTQLWPMMCHGVEFHNESGGQLVGDCPFCLRDNHFYADPKTSKWDCKNCGEGGNGITLLGKVAAAYVQDTRLEDVRKLASDRGLPVRAFQRFGVGFDGKYYTIPCRSEKGTVRDIRRWKMGTKNLMATKGCSTQLFNADALAKTGSGGVVWLCEGEWDAMAMTELLIRAKRVADVAVAVPGTDTFKDPWRLLFKGKDVVICYDNDEPGDRGSTKPGWMLKGVAKKIRYLCWPEERPTGYDIRDFAVACLGKNVSGERAVRRLLSLSHGTHRRGEEYVRGLRGDGTGGNGGGRGPGPSPAPDPDPGLPARKGGLLPVRVPKFEEVVTVFRKSIKMDPDMVTGLKVILATALAWQVPGESLWMYIVGPSGSGKTLLIQSLRASQNVIFRSTVTPTGLVSGFRDATDPSLLAKLVDVCLAIKDGTTILSLPQFMQDNLWGILRDAYDGTFEREFGNSTFREYHPHFSMVFGVTPRIHAVSHSNVGERFLKFDMHKDGSVDPSDQIGAAIDDVGVEAEREQLTSEVVARFLSQKVNPKDLPKRPQWVRNRIIALSQLISMLRATVETEVGNDEDLKYRPRVEVGTRLGKNFTLLSYMLALVEGKRAIDYETYRTIERVAMDTAIGWHVETLAGLFKYGPDVEQVDLSEKIRIPTSTLNRRLRVMEHVGLVTRRLVDRSETTNPQRRGRTAYLYSPSHKATELWRRAGVGRRPSTEELRGI